MAIQQASRTYRDGAGASVTIRGYEDTVAGHFWPAGILYDHLGNVLTADSDPPSGVIGVKVTLMTAAQAIGFDNHDAPITTADNFAAPSAVSTDADAVRAWYDRLGRAQGIVTERAAAGQPAHNQVSVGTSATAVVGASAKRRRVAVMQHGTIPVFFGTTAGVTTSTGFRLPGIEGFSRPFFVTTGIWAIVASGTQVISYLDEVNS
jgi:hypothetical protein